MKFIIVSIISITLFLTSCKTEPTIPVKLSKLYSNHMVIQRDKDICIFAEIEHFYGLAYLNYQ